MSIKKKMMIVIFIPLLVFGTGITYSMFNINTNLSGEQNVAQFIFNAERMNELELPITDLNPGDEKTYEFSVSNNKDGKISATTIEYQLTIKTMRLIPLNIKLYKINENEEEEPIIECNGNYTRNDDNEIVCNVLAIMKIEHSSPIDDNYKLKIKFPDEYDSEEYSNLVDYIDIEIKSSQKLTNGESNEE